jgi:hypothetical protein
VSRQGAEAALGAVAPTAPTSGGTEVAASWDAEAAAGGVRRRWRPLWRWPPATRSRGMAAAASHHLNDVQPTDVSHPAAGQRQLACL